MNREVGKVHVIGITVSTNYSDLLPIVIPANVTFFKEWIIVTDIYDYDTVSYLKAKNVIVLYWDFKSKNSVFDKGGAIAHAQQFAYRNFPNDWYLILDSDIVLDETMSLVKENLERFDVDAIYGAGTRRDFVSLTDFMEKKNYFDYPWANQLQGYFQLYKKHSLYEESFDASVCDMKFIEKFDSRVILNNVICNHLGRRGNWRGRVIAEDFRMK